MNSPHTRISAPLPVVLILVLLAALVGAIGGGATAAKLITGKQIKNNSVSTKDIKNRSLKLKDVKKSEAAKLQGKDGHSSYQKLPSGTTVTGGGFIQSRTTAEGQVAEGFTPLPFVTTVPLDAGGAGRNLFVEPTPAFAVSHQDAVRCAGSDTAPTAAPGTLCVYMADYGFIDEASGYLGAGADLNSGDGAESNGFYISIGAAGAGRVFLAYVWAYTAP